MNHGSSSLWFQAYHFEAKPDPWNSEIVLGGLIIIILHHFSRGAHHALFAMENMGITDYMANGIKMEQNIVLLASLQAINSNSRS